VALCAGLTLSTTKIDPKFFPKRKKNFLLIPTLWKNLGAKLPQLEINLFEKELNI